MLAAIRNGLIMLQAEFESSQLEIALVPCRRDANVGGCIRVAVSKNATWYRDFCARHASSRVRRKQAFDTRIKRRNVERLLARLVAGESSSSKYTAEILKLAARATAQPQRRIA